MLLRSEYEFWVGHRHKPLDLDLGPEGLEPERLRPALTYCSDVCIYFSILICV